MRIRAKLRERRKQNLREHEKNQTLKAVDGKPTLTGIKENAYILGDKKGKKLEEGEKEIHHLNKTEEKHDSKKGEEIKVRQARSVVVTTDGHTGKSKKRTFWIEKWADEEFTGKFFFPSLFLSLSLLPYLSFSWNATVIVVPR